MKLSPEDQKRRELAAVKAALGPGKTISQLMQLPIDQLKSYDRQARTHNDKQIDTIARSMQAFGWINPVLIDRHNVIVAGEGRLKAAKRLGLTHAPCLRIEGLSPDELRAYRLADNRLAELAGWDEQIVTIELQHLTSIDLDFNIEVLGWNMPVIDIMFDAHASAPGNLDDAPDAADDIPAEGTRAVSRIGDLWLLGRHRVLCSSALNPVAYTVLLKGEKVRLIVQDPPWNCKISYISGSGTIKHREFVMASGEMSDPQFREFLATQIHCNVAHAVPGAVIEIFIDWRGVEKVIAAGIAEGLELINICVWSKTNGGMGSPWRSAHELVVVFRKPGAPIRDRVNLGRHGRYRTNVWHMAGQNSFGPERMEALTSHPTSKPVQLIAEAIRDVTDIGDIVLDSFLGSGTTVLAAERTGRIARGMELDPLYVDTVIRRWEKFTGQQAIHEQSGRTFTTIEAECLDQAETTNIIKPPVRQRVRASLSATPAGLPAQASTLTKGNNDD